jgi:hypothetical protein
MNAALRALAITSAMVMAVSCGRSKDDRGIEPVAQSRGMKKIYLALMSYEVKHGHLPNRLSDLVDKGLVTKEDLLFRRVDGSLDKLEYFPKAKEGTSALLALEPDRDTGKIIVNVDGSIHSESKTERVGSSNGDESFHQK